LRDSKGQLFGTTDSGGTSGFGTVSVLNGTKETVLHSFNDDDGAYPFTHLLGVSDAVHGVTKLWGATNGGGKHDFGTVFSLERRSESQDAYRLLLLTRIERARVGPVTSTHHSSGSRKRKLVCPGASERIVSERALNDRHTA
jgi:uncharacterized repeat protein (TIGR03803 family)